ncbi:histone deacetylase [Ferrimonas balearica]|uniref:histone deacetylase family protein n=1 Tax=Ferrimonas balearica TaxID=44012 RepID=UPI001C999AAD|nr:histone deacetylase [Ferrimonas balearica]MBY5921166.1 histone deacetylase [Ferrimonas balearica]MBY5996149.1 histone deacetylase [Ferrimonas balearica]
MLQAVYHPIYSALPLPDNHRFPIHKYRLLYEHLLREGVLHPDAIHQPEPLTLDQVAQVHCPDYVRRFAEGTLDPKAQRRLGFPWSAPLVQRTLTACGGTVRTAELALEHGVACHLSGGYHHAHRDFGSGFCVFNDLVLAARLMMAQQQLSRILILDCDVHQGDGTATLCQDDPEIITCSLHCERNFPARKAHSHIDIPLDNGVDDVQYLATLNELLPWLLNLYQPDLILYDAGVDVHRDDALGYLELSDAGLFQRDHAVMSAAMDRGIPVAAVIGGGYAKCHGDLIPRHQQLFLAASEFI